MLQWNIHWSMKWNKKQGDLVRLFILYYFINVKCILTFSINWIELPYQVIPRFYQTFFESGVAKIQLILGNPRERNITTSNGVQFLVECMSASIEYHFANGIQVNFYITIKWFFLKFIIISGLIVFFFYNLGYRTWSFSSHI